MRGEILSIGEAMLEGFRFKLIDGRLHFYGISFGYGKSDPYLVASAGDYMVIRKPSVMDWASLGSSATYPAEWILIKVKPDEKDDSCQRVVEVIEEKTPGRKWHKAKKELISKMTELVTETK